MAASHAKLLADQTNAPVIAIAGNLQSFGSGYRARNWPGRLSKYEGVYALTPNTYLDLNLKRPQRFYPLRPMPQRSPAEAAEIVSVHLRNAVANFRQNYLDGRSREALVFLTGGIDSRLVLGAFNGHEKVLAAFSYENGGAHNEDLRVALMLAHSKAIPHHIHYVDDDINQRLSRWASDNGAGVYIGSKSVLTYCFANLRGYKYGLRGNLGEISRGVLSARSAFIDEPARFMARIWLRGSERVPLILELFIDYAEAIEIDKTPCPLRILYYWEHRHATWHAANINELDCAFDTFNIMNSRNIIEAMCGVSLDDQKLCSVHLEAIRLMDAGILDFPLKQKIF